jgi:hypothetical protein
MLTELFIRYFFSDTKQQAIPIQPSSEDRLEFLNVVVWLVIACICAWVVAKIL